MANIVTPAVVFVLAPGVAVVAIVDAAIVDVLIGGVGLVSVVVLTASVATTVAVVRRHP